MDVHARTMCLPCYPTKFSARIDARPILGIDQVYAELMRHAAQYQHFAPIEAKVRS